MNDLEKLDLLHLLEYLVLNCFVGGIVACMSSSTLLEMGRCVPGPYGSILLLGWIQQLIWEKTWYMIRDETVFIPSVFFHSLLIEVCQILKLKLRFERAKHFQEF